MRILLYGGNGLLGRKFIEYNNRYKKHELFIGNNNITEQYVFFEIEKFSPNIIINFAGLVNYLTEYAVNVFYSNVLGPINLSNQTDLFNEEYDKKVKVITIGSTCDNDLNSNIYSYSKKCLLGLTKYLDNLSIIRIPGIFSTERKNGAIYEFYKNAINNKKIIINSDLSKWNCLFDESAIETIYNNLDYILLRKISNISYDGMQCLNNVAELIKKYLKSKSKIIINNQPLPSKISSAGIESKDQLWIFTKNKLKKDLKTYVEKNLYNS